MCKINLDTSRGINMELIPKFFSVPWNGPRPFILRKLINVVLPTDSALEAFCLDHFPQVSTHFSSGMDRTAKVSLLFLYARDGDMILEKLRESDGARLSRFEYILHESSNYFDSDIENHFIEEINCMGAELRNLADSKRDKIIPAPKNTRLNIEVHWIMGPVMLVSVLFLICLLNMRY